MKLYLIISRLFEPFLILIVVLIMGIHRSSLAADQQLKVGILLFITSAVLPIGLLLLAVKNKIVKDWDLRDRKERPKMIVFLLILELISLGIVFGVGDSFLFQEFLFLYVYVIGFGIISSFWKISGHTGFNSLGIGLLFIWYGWKLLPLAFIIPLVAWARVAGKYHTLAQVIGGIVYSIIVLSIYYFLRI